MLRLFLILPLIAIATGCGLVPEISHQPMIQNPFPQLSKVAVAPFFNLSDEPTVDGEQFAMAYFNELQATPGFEVVPVSVVKRAIQQYQIEMNDPGAARRLAQILEVDAVVVGAITEFSPYYPPRCGIQVEWWAANPCFHAIPPGYGLPWGTSEEEFIPKPLVYEAEMALAREQLKTQSPDYQNEPLSMPPAPQEPALLTPPGSAEPGRVQSIAHTEPIAPTGVDNTTMASAPRVPEGWPDERGFFPQNPSPVKPECAECNEPVLRHTSVYHGNDPDFTEALADYEYFRNDARYDGWQGYLQRSDDFIRFCCHLHIAEMLSARGGAGETRVVKRWWTVR